MGTPSGLVQSNIKSFWSRPEGKTGMIFLALGVGAVVWFWGVIVPYIVSMLVDTVHMAFLGGELAGMFYLVFGKMPRRIYRLVMRALTGLIIQIDPIGILKDNLLQAKKRRDELNEKIGVVSGSKQTLKDIIAKNQRTIEQDLALAEEAKRRSTDTKLDAATRLRMQYDMKLKTNEVGRLQQSDENYTGLLTKISDLPTVRKLSTAVISSWI